MNQLEKEKHLARLKKFQPPKGFSSRAAARTTVTKLRQGEKVLTPEDVGKLNDLDGLLVTAALGLAAENEMTLGMIKPGVNEGIGLPADDDEAAQAIVAAVGVENVALLFYTLMNRVQAENFYGNETVARLEKIPSETPGLTVAESHLRFIISGPISMILISRPEGDATGWWREKMGATRPSQAHPDSIRGKHATDKMMPNNLVHGSANPKEAATEIAAFQSIVEDLIKLGSAAL